MRECGGRKRERGGRGGGGEREGGTDMFVTDTVFSMWVVVFCREPTVFGEDDFTATPLHHAARKGESCVLLCGYWMSFVK